MKNQSSFVTKILKFAFELALLGFTFSLLSIIWVFISHHFQWEMPRKYYSSINFTDLFNADKLSFDIILFIEFINTILKILLFWFAVKILKHLNFENPFNEIYLSLIHKITLTAFAIGILSLFLVGYIETYVDNKLLLSTQIGDSNYLIIAGVIYIVAHLYRKALELKTENDLTI